MTREMMKKGRRMTCKSKIWLIVSSRLWIRLGRRMGMEMEMEPKMVMVNKT